MAPSANARPMQYTSGRDGSADGCAKAQHQARLISHDIDVCMQQASRGRIKVKKRVVTRKKEQSEPLQDRAFLPGVAGIALSHQPPHCLSEI